MKVALLQKHGLVAIVGLMIIGETSLLYRYDPRTGVTIATQESAEIGLKNWMGSIRTSKRRQWQVLYVGAPLRG